MTLAWLRALRTVHRRSDPAVPVGLWLFFGSTGCLLESNPAFSETASESSTTAPASSTASDGDASDADGTTAEPTTSSTSLSSGEAESSTGVDVPPMLDPIIVDLGSSQTDAAPRLAWSGSTLGASWDVHAQFVRLAEDGTTMGLAEVPLGSDMAKTPSLGATDEAFYAAYADFNGEVHLLERQATDTWVSLGRKDMAEDTLWPTVDRRGTGLVMGWREDVVNFRVAALDAEGTVTGSALVEIGSAHYTDRLLDTSEGLYTLLRSDNGARKLLHHDPALTFVSLSDLNDGPAEVVWESASQTFTFVAARDGSLDSLVMGSFDGTSIQGELEVVVADAGTIGHVRIVGGEGRYLVAWQATLPDATTSLQLGRWIDDEPFESVILDDAAASMTDFVDNGVVAAVGWPGAEGPRVALVPL